MAASEQRPVHQPFIPPESNLRELTVVPIVVGMLLGIVFGASSLYLVLKVGLTVSASIPVAVISITLFRLLGKLRVRNATILENNIVQTAGSAGESIAFGVGVTMPAIMILGFDLEIARVTLVAVLGGLLGILMMIPLRRALIVQQHGILKYPEGTACAEVLKAGASDIHLETDARGLTVKYRIDGVLSHVAQIAGTDVAEQAVSRIKVMSELDIAERRVPQDGRFKVAMQGREVDVRVSVMPSVFGEDAVLRILDRQALSEELAGLTLEGLGYAGTSLARIRKLAAEPYGMLLVTGPTGSGKTTTLYAAISEINHGRDKIVTIEDPVEYQLPGVLQIPVNEKKGLSFARGLRSILRHDPDKIMVGEIRDADTAQIAVQSALTGHLVFTTVHANNVFDVIGRFIHMGVDPYSFVSALNGIVAQRLVRMTCQHCAQAATPNAELLELSGLSVDDTRDYNFRQGAGCGHCRGSGYKGRRAVAEILLLTDTLRELVVARAPIGQIKEAATRGGTRNLRDEALALVKAGDTTLEEINRVTLVG